MFIIQLMAKKKKLAHSNNGHKQLKVYTSEHLKIHPVEADTEAEAIEKVNKYYAENKPDWVIRVVDSEATIK